MAEDKVNFTSLVTKLREVLGKKSTIPFKKMIIDAISSRRSEELKVGFQYI